MYTSASFCSIRTSFISFAKVCSDLSEDALIHNHLPAAAWVHILGEYIFDISSSSHWDS